MPAVRARSQLVGALGRVAMLGFWSLALWGVLVLASTLANVMGEGPTAAFARLLPARGASVWVWLSPLAMLLALVAGLGAAVLAVWNRRRAPETDN
jgi:hypothetical protein